MPELLGREVVERRYLVASSSSLHFPSVFFLSACYDVAEDPTWQASKTSTIYISYDTYPSPSRVDAYIRARRKSPATLLTEIERAVKQNPAQRTCYHPFRVPCNLKFDQIAYRLKRLPQEYY